MISSVAVCHFPSPRPCVPTEKDKRAWSENLSLTSSDTTSSKKTHVFHLLVPGTQSASRVRGHTTLHHPRLCLDTSWREKIRKARQFQTWWFGNDHSTCALLSLLLRIVRDARVSGCEPRAPVPPLFVKQKKRPLRHEQQAEKKTNYVWHQQDALACTCGSPSNHATFANACNPSLVHAQNPSWAHFGKESLLSRRSRARKIPSHSRDIFLQINWFCGERNTSKIH